MSATLELVETLISRASVTPDDAGCLDLIGERLARCGFTLERFDHEGVANLWATRGNSAPVFCFAGHTDVVPTGDLAAWGSDPFQPVIREGVLRNMEWCGLEFDPARNKPLKGEGPLHKDGSRVQAWVIPTNEEIVVARQTSEALESEVKSQKSKVKSG
jgi:hypothetical protein